MTVEVDTFMVALELYMRSTASIAASPRSTFLYVAPELPSVATWSILTPFNPRLDHVGLLTCGVQCMTIGDDAAAMSRAQAMYATLLDDEGKPMQRKEFSSHRAVGVLSLTAPAPLGRDEKKRTRVVFNFDAQVVRLP